MEEGSLLEQALRHDANQLLDANIDDTKNVLLLDVYSVDSDISHDKIQLLLHLAKLAGRCNTFLQSKQYKWHFGGDGPVFGVHVGAESVPHLRAYCRYGPNVADEWMAIDLMVEMSQEMKEEVAITCWDAEDGQVILVQTSDVLPAWLDTDPTDTHRYALWLRAGNLQLFQQSHISLEVALHGLERQTRDAPTSHPKIQNALQLWLGVNRQHALKSQRTPLVLPRRIAALMRNREDLVHAAIQAFCDNIDVPPPDLTHHEDWVWTVHPLSRTNYAMLRTMVSSEWKSAKFLPPVGVEVKRYKRQCSTEATPHIQHAVCLGTRLVVGFDLLAKARQSEMFSVDQRLTKWHRIDEQSLNNNSVRATENGNMSWILQSYQQGPNHSTYDLEDILKCPVFPEEASNVTLYTHPDTLMKQQLLNGQKMSDSNEDFSMPQSDQVDDEKWLSLEGEESVDGKDLDTMLSRFQTFMVQPSGAEGVATGVGESTTSNVEEPPTTRRDLRPRVFMNILHTVLKGGELSFLEEKDPFFYQEDYDLMETPDDENENDDSNENHEIHAMRDMMDAMDMELEDKTKSRELDDFDVGDASDGVGCGSLNRAATENAHVLNNLLKSLEASAGDAGPVPNMLKEMGAEPPRDL